MESMKREPQGTVCTGMKAAITSLHQNPSVKSKSSSLFLYVLTISLCAFPIGWDLGTTGNLMDLPTFRARNEVSSQKTGLIISVFNIGCILACFFLSASQLTRRVGHLASFQFCEVLFLTATCVTFLGIINTHSSLWLFCIGRLLAGFSGGASSVVGPIYVSHICTFTNASNMYLAVFHIMTSVFVVLGNCLFCFSSELTEYMCCLISFSVPVIALSCSTLLPASPLDELIFRNPDTLKQSLSKLLQDGTMAEIDHCVTSTAYALDSGESGPRKHRRIDSIILGTCCTLSALQQLTGASFYFYFGKTMFDQMIFSSNSANLSGMLISLCNLSGTCLFSIFVYLVGARKPLLYGSALLSCLLFAFATLGVIREHRPAEDIGIGLSMLSVSCVFILTFASTWGPCCSVLSIEISRSNGQIMSYAVICGWVTNILVMSFFPVLIEEIGYGAMYLFLLFTASSVWVTRKDFRYTEK